MAKTGKKIGLALGGGGARGLAHIGVIKALREANIPIDYIAGTSMGALVGGFYAATGNMEMLEQIFLKLRREDIFSMPRLIARRNGVLFRKEEIADAIQKEIGSKKIEDMRIPFAAIATDAENGETIVMKSGSLASAIRGSIAMPIMFQPTKRDKHLLIDGGFSNPVPADIVRGMGADYVIAVDVTSQWMNVADERISIKNLYGVLSNALSVVEYQISRNILNEANIILRPPVLNYSWLAFDKVDELVAAGADETRANLLKICDETGRSRPEQTFLDKFIDFIRGTD